MKCRSLLNRFVILGTACLLVVSLGACKKKSKKKGGKAPQKVEDVKPDPKKKKVADEPKFGAEQKEGNSVIYRGEDKVFFVKATPHTVGVGQNVGFEWQCGANNEGRMSWDMGDQTTLQHAQTLGHVYRTAGTYQVRATCTQGALVQTGIVSILVQNQTNGNAGGPTSPHQSPAGGGTNYQNPNPYRNPSNNGYVPGSGNGTGNCSDPNDPNCYR